VNEKVGTGCSIPQRGKQKRICRGQVHLPKGEGLFNVIKSTAYIPVGGGGGLGRISWRNCWDKGFRGTGYKRGEDDLSFSTKKKSPRGKRGDDFGLRSKLA